MAPPFSSSLQPPPLPPSLALAPFPSSGSASKCSDQLRYFSASSQSWSQALLSLSPFPSGCIHFTARKDFGLHHQHSPGFFPLNMLPFSSSPPLVICKVSTIRVAQMCTRDSIVSKGQRGRAKHKPETSELTNSEEILTLFFSPSLFKIDFQGLLNKRHEGH